MGNSASVQEKVYAAVVRNDVNQFQELVNSFGPTDPVARARVLEHKDKSGRTPLLVAASKNHYQILQKLVALGANVHYINPSREAAGGALHEAAAKRHEAVVEALIHAGASPFAANAAGRTALDEAVLSGHAGVVRTIETCADFSGYVAVKSRAMGGMSSKHKQRWAVLMPYYPFNAATNGTSPAAAAAAAASGSGNGPKPRRCLWLYKDKGSQAPRCRMWVDGAVVITHGPAGTEGTLRLHTSHAEPVGDVSTRYERGYCVSLRPADLTPAAASVYHRLVGLINQGTAASASQATPGGSAPSSTAPPATPGAYATPAPSYASYQPSATGAPAPAPQPPYAPPVAPYAASAGAVAVYATVQGYPYAVHPGAVSQPPQYYPALPPPAVAAVAPAAAAAAPSPGHPVRAPSPAYPGAAGPSPVVSPLSMHLAQRPSPPPAPASLPPPPPAPARTQSHRAPDAGAQAPASPAHAAVQRSSASSSQLPRAGEAAGAGGAGADAVATGVGGAPLNARFIEAMAALPGETDEDFAGRLASAINAASGQSQDALYAPPAPQQPSSQQQLGQPPPPHPPAPPPPQQQPSSVQHQPVDPFPAAYAGHQLYPRVYYPPSPPGGIHAASAAGADPRHATAAAALAPSYSDPGAGAAASAPPAPPQLLYPALPQSQPQPQRPAGAGGGTGLDELLDIDALNATLAADVAARQQAAVPPLPPPPQQPAPPPQQQQQLLPLSFSEPPRPPQQQLQQAAAPPAPELLKAPSAPPAASAPPAPDPDADQCVICLSAPKEVGFLHGDTVHRCVCRECSARVRIGAPCPLCRQCVERVLGVF